MKVKNTSSRTKHNAEFNQHHLHSILLVVFGSFVVGAIPITYGLRLTPVASQNNVTVPGEATLWKPLGQR